MGAFTSTSFQSSQPSTPPPSYSAPATTTTQPALPQATQRPSIVVPVPPVQNVKPTTNAPRPKEPEPAKGMQKMGLIL